MTTTCQCGQPSGSGFICGGCTRAMEIALANIKAYWCDLDNIRGKLTRYGSPNGGRSKERPLPIDHRFAGRWEDGSMIEEQARNTITTWTRLVLEERPVITGPTCGPACLHISCASIRRSRPPADNIPSCCNYLLGHTEWVRVKDFAPEMVDELDSTELQMRRLVDRPADRWFAGPCDQCERDLYAKTGAQSVTCQECDLVYDVLARRQWLLEQAEDRLVNATLLARAVSWLGSEPLTAARVWQWAKRKRIVAKAHETSGGRTFPLYRIGDALDLLASDTQKAG